MQTTHARANPYAQPRQSAAPALSRTGRALALVLLLHAGVFLILHSVMQLNVPAKLAEAISAHIVVDLKPPAPPKLVPPPPPVQPKTQKPPAAQPTPVAPSTAPIPLAQAPSTTPAITVAPAAAAPAQNAPSTATVAPVQPKKMVPATAVNGSCQEPRYPAISQRLQEEGLVKLLLHISETGKVIESSVKESSGYKRLDAAALAALSLCSYKPATVDGKPQASWITQPYRWNIVNE